MKFILNKHDENLNGRDYSNSDDFEGESDNGIMGGVVDNVNEPPLSDRVL